MAAILKSKMAVVLHTADAPMMFHNAEYMENSSTTDIIEIPYFCGHIGIQYGGH